jgi:hypothetical protein
LYLSLPSVLLKPTIPSVGKISIKKTENEVKIAGIFFEKKIDTHIRKDVNNTPIRIGVFATDKGNGIG